MNLQQFTDADDRMVRQYAYEDGDVIVADLGAADGAATVDVVDGTVIVVVETPEGSQQTEIELPSDDAEVFIKNGVLTIEVER